MPRLLRAFAAVLALALSGIGLAACGGGGDESSQSPQQLLQETFGANKPVKSGNLGLSLDVAAQGLQGVKGPIALKLSGPFESQGKGKLPTFDLTLTLQTGPTNFTAGAVSTGDKGFLKVQGKTYGPAKNTPPMTGFGPLANDEEIAAVISYVRQSFGNDLNFIKPEQVKAIRE